MSRWSVKELEDIAVSKERWQDDEALSWCRRYARAHYENFQVSSLFLPRQLRNAYTVLYAFARGADWRADDIAADLPEDARKAVRRQALAEWRQQLSAVYSEASPSHPAFIALRRVIEKYPIEQDSFDAMIRAFERDQGNGRYETWADVLRYTEGSANPVGRWVLRVHGLHDPELDRLSDSVCTGLQLVNFMQDIRSDLVGRNRVYLPLEELRQFVVTEEMLAHTPTPEPVRRLLAFEAERADTYLSAGIELIKQVQPPLRNQLTLFVGGGKLALDALKRADWDAGSRHRRVTRMDKAGLILRAYLGRTL